MPTIAEITRIQDYLRESARRNYQAMPLAPFTVFFHPHNSLKYF